MTTKVRGEGWKIVVQEDGLFQVQTEIDHSHYRIEAKDIPNIEEAILRLVRVIDIGDSQLRTTQSVRTGAGSYLKGDWWRIAKQDDCYAVQTRPNGKIKWSHDSVETRASYGNVEGALDCLASLIWVNQGHNSQPPSTSTP